MSVVVNARHNGDHATNLPFSVSIIDHFTGVVTFLTKPLPLFYNPVAQKMHISSYFNAISVLTMILSFEHGIANIAKSNDLVISECGIL